jgi:hypothetical protein
VEYEPVINLKAAKTLGLDVSQMLRGALTRSSSRCLFLVVHGSEGFYAVIFAQNRHKAAVSATSDQRGSFGRAAPIPGPLR